IGAAGGAAAGALAGQIIGKNTKGTLIGAAVGAAVGGAAGAGVGHMMDRQEQEFNQALAASNAAAVRREGNLLAITLKGDVSFDSGSAKINPGLYSEIDRIAQIMTQYPQTRIQVEGHTDSKGKDASNMELSRKRADAVMNLLVQRGVDPGKITIMPFGESQPVSTNATPEGRQKNRRVEIKIEPTDAG
ncbi:OmpA family protein, partial [Desulfobacterales bacterium HSG17]|nr:OmpA family protein [Desulfobacterales bacterium HSG17]